MNHIYSLALMGMMTFPGIKDARQRADLLVFLKDATQPGHAPSTTAEQNGQMGGMWVEARFIISRSSTPTNACKELPIAETRTG
jgi:hypothetical protein